jgi:uncharacterized protein YaeQ
MKYTFTIKQVGEDSGSKLVVERAPSEVEWHIALKLLGYILFYDRKPRIEEDVDYHYRPDLFARDDFGQVNLWIDCGNIATKKIDKVATKMGKSGEFYILRQTQRDANRLRESVSSGVKHKERVKIVTFEDGFVEKLAEALDSTNEITFKIEGGNLTITLKNKNPTLEATTRLISV